MKQFFKEYKIQIFKYSTGIFLAYFIWSLIFIWTSSNNYTSKYNQFSDSLYKYKDKYGKEITKTKVWVNNYEELKSSKSKEIQELKALVNKKTQSATILVVSTKDSASTKTSISYSSKDSIYLSLIKDSSNLVYPIYSSSWGEEYSTGYIIATKDSIYRNILIKNKFKISHEWSSKSIFRPKSLFKQDSLSIVVKNDNISTTTDSLQSYIKIPKDKTKQSIVTGGILGFTLATIIGIIFLK